MTELRAQLMKSWASDIMLSTVGKLIKDFDAVQSEATDAECVYYEKNTERNRYSNIPCLDRTRFILPGDESFYIHANYVKGCSRPDRFVCTQGPMEHTMCHFWKMAIALESTAIIMLCDFEESGKDVCSKYFSETIGCVDLDDVEVFTESCVEVECGSYPYTQRQLRVVDKLTGKESNLTHYQYATWPNQGMPPYCKTSLRLLSSVRKNEKPVIVHCSTGVGRTGTLVFIESMISSMRLLKEPGAKLHTAKESLAILRQDRAKSVQTFAQYVYALRCVIEYFISKGLQLKQEELNKFAGTYAKCHMPDELKKKMRSLHSSICSPPPLALLVSKEGTRYCVICHEPLATEAVKDDALLGAVSRHAKTKHGRKMTTTNGCVIHQMSEGQVVITYDLKKVFKFDDQQSEKDEEDEEDEEVGEGEDHPRRSNPTPIESDKQSDELADDSPPLRSGSTPSEAPATTQKTPEASQSPASPISSTTASIVSTILSTDTVVPRECSAVVSRKNLAPMFLGKAIKKERQSPQKTEVQKQIESAETSFQEDGRLLHRICVNISNAHTQNKWPVENSTKLLTSLNKAAIVFKNIVQMRGDGDWDDVEYENDHVDATSTSVEDDVESLVKVYKRFSRHHTSSMASFLPWKSVMDCLNEAVCILESIYLARIPSS